MDYEIHEEYMVFLKDGAQGIGAVRRVSSSNIVIYVENAGEFTIPRNVIKDVHSQKVLLKADLLDPKLVNAINRIHQSEDARKAG